MALKKILEVKDLVVKYSDLPVINGVSFDVRDGEFLSVVGPSGCGKTTLLLTLAGLLKPQRGEIRLNGHRIAGPGVERGLVYQDFALFPWRTVLENTAFALEVKNVPREKRVMLAREALEIMDMVEHEDKYPSQLSGGMKQRVAMARALVNNPKILLLDESFGALDPQTRYRLEEDTIQLWQAMKKTVVLVTHMTDEAVYLSDRIILLSEGRIKNVYDVSIRRPRNRDSPAIRKRVREIEGTIGKPSKIGEFMHFLGEVEAK